MEFELAVVGGGGSEFELALGHADVDLTPGDHVGGPGLPPPVDWTTVIQTAIALMLYGFTAGAWFGIYSSAREGRATVSLAGGGGGGAELTIENR